MTGRAQPEGASPLEMLRLRVAAAARANGGAGLAPLDQELNQLLNSILGAAGLEPSPAEEEEASDEALGRGSPSAAPQQQPQPPRPLLGSPTVAPLSAAAAPHRIPAGERALYGELPPDCAFLRPGQQFEGRQRVAAYHGINPKHETWEVSATIQQYDRGTGYVAGTMEARDVPEAPAPVTTFFEGEIVDNVNHTFFTADWDACRDTDIAHWCRFDSFKGLHAEVVLHAGRCPSLGAHPYVYMRWKEQFFVRGSESRLTISGFYYIRVCRATGAVDGMYFDPLSSPDQKLSLTAVRAGPAGFSFPAFELA